MSARLPNTVPQDWQGETYHGRPVVKASSFDWKVSAYIVMLGIAGSAQVIAAVARRQPGSAGLVRRARWLALAGSMVGPLTLVQHLKTRSRWFNMLRIVRPTSPMSLGSWLLTGFGALSGATALGAWLGRRWPLAGRVAEAAQGPAALAGAGMSIYTASLLSSTSTPLWAAAPAPLAAQFGTASMAGAASALALVQRAVGEERSARRLETLAMLAGAAELLAKRETESRWRRAGIAAPAKEGAPGALLQGGGTWLGLLAPIAAHALGRAADRRGGRAGEVLPELASLAMILGGAAMRHGVLLAGNESACRPRDAFRVTQR
ncbi:NrfD/PsrC family molybdoenzyme membrane anchor subunit [Roseicella aerolata]|uniref:Polysulfide reductase NrfD n=1 Tax=Roseicella aerolata TaxID=2883479 RepID=A0A9X1LAI5_9PROT|nr:NrfD/PsrC family molybdoenzyme membrane anchor subunit [Roseicella aerolata]MCB4825011.1 polysulfide reductase NrfD [Roseicella aerolata]